MFINNITTQLHFINYSLIIIIVIIIIIIIIVIISFYSGFPQ